MDTIFTASMRRCIEEQEEAAMAAFCSRAARNREDLLGAVTEQANARQAHEEMRIRLERLIGVA